MAVLFSSKSMFNLLKIHGLHSPRSILAPIVVKEGDIPFDILCRLWWFVSISTPGLPEEIPKTRLRSANERLNQGFLKSLSFKSSDSDDLFGSLSASVIPRLKHYKTHTVVSDVFSVNQSLCIPLCNCYSK